MSEEMSAETKVGATRESLNAKVRKVINNPLVYEAFLKLDRKEFMPPEFHEEAYEDYALTLGENTSITKPSLEGLMIDALEIKSGMRVFELGTGTGHQASWLSLIGCQVYSTDNNSMLCESAKVLLPNLGIEHVNIFAQDGTYGLPECAPFDAMVISAALREIPEQLTGQLKESGVIVMPIGKDPNFQRLVKGKKVEGNMTYEVLDEEVWFYKAFTDIPGGWTEELLQRSRQLKINYISMILNALPPVEKEELSNHLNAARLEYPENDSFTWENYPEYLSKDKRMSDDFFESYLKV